MAVAKSLEAQIAELDNQVEALTAENERLLDENERLRADQGLSLNAPLQFSLTGKEACLFGRLIALKGAVGTKQALMDAMYNGSIDEPEIKIVDVFVCKLRKKLKPFGVDIQTVWGQGYRIEPDVVARFKAEWGHVLGG